MDDKYIRLLIDRCLNFKKSNILFISYDKVNKDFVLDIVEYAKKKGINDIYLDESDIYKLRDKLLNESYDEIKNDSYFDKSIWNEYANKYASFLMIDTEFPHVMDDVDSDKFALARKISMDTRQDFRDKETSYEIAWCIAAYPNKVWAEDVFKNDDSAYEKLHDVILKMCMVDKDDPIKAWEEFRDDIRNKVNYLNGLEIKQLHYTNSLGTDLYIDLPDNSIWNSISDEEEDDMFVNMPSYEIFTSPDYRKSNGIVYNSKPLMYGGNLIDNFYLKFKDGKVVEYDAKVGKDILSDIICSFEHCDYLGEVALVPYDSPISNTNLVFGTTLFDENASCHLALGDGFPLSIKNGINMSEDELLKHGINQCKNHVDFMVGTSDLRIDAITNKGEVLIFKDGNFNI